MNRRDFIKALGGIVAGLVASKLTLQDKPATTIETTVFGETFGQHIPSRYMRVVYTISGGQSQTAIVKLQNSHDGQNWQTVDE